MANELTSINQNIKDLVSGMKGHVQKLGSTIGGHVSDVMSEEMKMTTDTIKSGFTFAKNASVKTLAFFGKSFGIDWKSLKVQIGQLKMLQLMNGQMKREEKTRLGRMKGRAKDFLAAILQLFGISLMAIGAVAGAWIGRKILPFTILAKTLNKLFSIGKGLKALVKVGPIASLIKAFGWIGKLFKFFIKFSGLGFILKGISYGFRKLVWPLQIIFSIIDFISGYMDTEGSIMDKIKGGLKNVIMKFIEWPIQMLTKLVNKIMNDALGEENWKDLDSAEILKKISEKLNEFFDSFDKTFKDMYQNLLDLINIINDPSWDNIKRIWNRNRKTEEERFAKLTPQKQKTEKWQGVIGQNIPGGRALNLLPDWMNPSKLFGEKIGKMETKMNETSVKWYDKLLMAIESIGKKTEEGNKERAEGNKFQKEKGGEIISVPILQQGKPTMNIPATTGIENRTAEELGISNGVFN